MTDRRKAARDALLDGLGELSEQVTRAHRAIEHEQPDLAAFDAALRQVATETVVAARAGERVRIEFSAAVSEAERIVSDVLDADA